MYFKTGELQPDASAPLQSDIYIPADAPSGIYEIGICDSTEEECEHSAIFPMNGIDPIIEVLARTHLPLIKTQDRATGNEIAGVGTLSVGGDIYISSKGKVPLQFIGFARHTQGTETKACTFSTETVTYVEVSGTYYIKQIA